ncbi:MAG: recombinase family protein [Oscillospiraceae bacterium]|nr:recombinase family protein [Oscillospiraceae bacterium]
MSAEQKIAAAYIRVSTDDQLEYSPDAQRAEIRKYAETHGYVLPEAFIFIDEGISGKQTAKREGFNRMICAAKQKPRPFCAILLWKFSRFARNREDSIVYKSMLRKQLGIEVISISEPVGDDKMSIILEAMIEAMDEYYSLNLAEEVRRGMTEKARRGELQASPAFGYRVEHNTLRPVPDEAALVQALFCRFIAGEGFFSLAQWLNSMGITTHRGNRFESRTIAYILQNPVYIGKLRWNPAGKTQHSGLDDTVIVADAAHAPIISTETFASAQRRLAQVKAQRTHRARPTAEQKDWMSGLIHCATCSAPLVFVKPHFWKCNGYAHGTCRTTQHISDEKLKAMLLACLQHAAPPSDTLHFHPAPCGTLTQTKLPAQKTQLTRKLTRLRNAYLAGVESLESYARAKAALEEQCAALDASPPDPADTPAMENVRTVAELLQSPDFTKEEKQRAVRSIIEACCYSKADNTLTITYRME